MGGGEAVRLTKIGIDEANRLGRKSDTEHKVCEARIGAQGVIMRQDFEVLHLRIVRRVGAFERLEGCLFVA